MIQVTIDGRTTEVEPGTTILAAAKQAGVAIPALCDSPLLEPYGVCRVCSVEVADGRRRRVVTGCNYPLEKPVEVFTTSERALRATEIIFATHQSARRRGRIDLPLPPGKCAMLAMLASGALKAEFST